MPRTNSATSYGSVAKGFHWLTALLILSNLPLGWYATEVAETVAAAPTEALITQATFLFSLHKTLGVAIFFVALARILWALSQPKPGLLNGDRGVEAWAAETAHWLLYGSLVLVPLSGWVHHAATAGFAPIWWPLGQNLPLVPKSETVSDLASTLHFVFVLVLAGTITAHVAGALKHHLLDADATLRRMLPGRMDAIPTARQPKRVLSMLAAAAIWLGTLTGAAALGWFGSAEDGTATLAAVESDWHVDSGRLQVTVTQLGSGVTGSFADWTADIAYSETPDTTGKLGTVEVVLSIASLTLGSVTQQAMGADFFNTAEFPTAVFAADLLATETGQMARGTLTIRDQSVSVEMPFDLSITGDSATAQGALSVDRRAFNIGNGVKDEKSLGFGVDVSFDLTAKRAN